MMMSREKDAVMLTSGASGRINALLSLRLWRSLFMVINAFVMLLFLPFRRRAAASSPGSQGGAGGSGAGKEEKKGVSVVRVPAAMVPARKSALAVDKEVAVRRALAIRRVVEDDDVSDCNREFMLLDTPRGVTLFTQSWTPVAVKPRGLVVLLHGLNEHSGRYNDFAKLLNVNGYKVFGMDWIASLVSRNPWENKQLKYCWYQFRFRIHHNGNWNKHWREGKKHYPNVHPPKGLKNPHAAAIGAIKYLVTLLIRHGGSDGLHAYVHSLDEAVSDMKLFIRKVMAEHPGLPCFCFGHSTGGAIILKAVLDPEIKPRIAGVVLTSPAVGVQPSHPIFAVLAPIFSLLLPRYQFSAANKRGVAVSRDPEALVAKYSDPLVFTGSIRIRTGYEILRITGHLQQNLKKLTVPFLVLHGTADAVTDPGATLKLYTDAGSTDKAIRLLDGLLHDLLFEPEREQIAGEIIEWLNVRT